MSNDTQPPPLPAAPPVPAVPALPNIAVVALGQVTARRCDGRVASVLGKAPTAADPYFFTADDGGTYVVKLVGGDRTAFNEAMFANVARRIELRVPEVVAIEIPGDLIGDDPLLSSIGYPSGLHVGVARLPNGSFDLRGDALSRLGPNLVIENAAELPGTVAFSSWIEDHDHATNDGNWMLEPRDNNVFIAWIIDFGHALRGPTWNAPLLNLINDPASVAKLGPHAIAVAACAQPNAFERSLASIEAITEADLVAVATSVPATWQPDAADRDRLAACLIKRRPGLAPALGVAAPGGIP